MYDNAIYIDKIKSSIAQVKDVKICGYVQSVYNCIVECSGISRLVSIGANCTIYDEHDKELCFAEVIKFDTERTYLIVAEDCAEIKIGNKVEIITSTSLVYPDESWQGRIINAMGKPIDNLGHLCKGTEAYPLYGDSMASTERVFCLDKIDVGVKAINLFTPVCKGQKIGIFSGSGIGKSTLISMLSNFTTTDVKIIGLIGERGIEVDKFIKNCFADGQQDVICVVATSDETAFMRRRVAYMTAVIAEFFRRKGKNVICLLDSITRFAMARREIGLALGELPTSRGYTASVFSEIPKIIESVGVSSKDKGSITGFISVLVEGDDENEIISDTLRGVLDGHILLDREIAAKNVFPAINILRSISRYFPDCNNDDENALIKKAQNVFVDYTEVADVLKLGLYKKGSNKELDKSIELHSVIERFLCQSPNQKVSVKEAFDGLRSILEK
ncbi:FliI/YscN family ATPase [Anaplasmataceae bacterium AB001_6]|nr:FliI/YscN family ATPase [Anaplasmataceae bacterium AB001_6]